MRTIVDEIPAASAKWLTMSADIFDADTAVETGLATWTAPDTEAALAGGTTSRAIPLPAPQIKSPPPNILFRDINASPRPASGESASSNCCFWPRRTPL